MRVQRINNNNTNFNGLIKFKNGKIINPNYIVSYKTNVTRKSLLPNRVMDMDIFIKDTGLYKRSFRFYNEKTKQLDWLDSYYNQKELAKKDLTGTGMRVR